MATIKVFDVNGVKELKCFDTLSEIPYVEDIEEEEFVEEDAQASDDSVDF